MEFDEMIELLRNPPETGVPETIHDDLMQAYKTTVDGSAAALAQREAALAEREAEITRMKALNFELMVKAPAQNDDNNNSDKDDDEPTPVRGIDSLFTTERRK